MNNRFSLENKTILVVGAAGRIGKEIVEGILEAGANVVALDRNEDALLDLETAYQDEARLLCCSVNIADKRSIEESIKKTEKRYGEIDGAVNAAYPRNSNYGRRFFDVTYEDFCENTSLHLGGYFLFMQQCAKYSVARGRKFSLVNMSSIYGVIPPRFDIYANTSMTMPVEYSAIKAGLIHLTRYVNAFTKGGLFRTNCVSPGGIFAEQNEHFLKLYNSHCMSKGMLDSQDIVGAVLFLLSDAAEFMVGQNVIIDDGFSL